ncbi:MAG TPA: hypothetical protein VGT60_10260 [Candidatus Limnocylindria bacterium]|nr:hypothetical protein [Candidatus Limnocylindria bacterium]
MSIGIVTGAASSSSALGAPQPSRVLVFEDGSGLRLTIQAEPAARDAGAFTLRVPGTGTFIAVTGATLAVESAQSTNVSYDGPVDLVSAQGTSTRVTARLQAHLDAPHHMGEATLTTATDRFHLVAHPASRAGLDPVLRSFEAAMPAGDWSAIYAIASSDFTSSYTAEAFAATARAQAGTVGTVVLLRRVQTGDVQTSPLGFGYVVVSYEVRRSVGGVISTSSDNVYFLFENGAWRLWFTVTQ